MHNKQRNKHLLTIVYCLRPPHTTLGRQPRSHICGARGAVHLSKEEETPTTFILSCFCIRDRRHAFASAFLEGMTWLTRSFRCQQHKYLIDVHIWALLNPEYKGTIMISCNKVVSVLVLSKWDINKTHFFICALKIMEWSQSMVKKHVLRLLILATVFRWHFAQKAFVTQPLQRLRPLDFGLLGKIPPNHLSDDLVVVTDQHSSMSWK